MPTDTETTTAPWVLELSSPMRILGSDPRATVVADNLGPASNLHAIADARLMAAAPDLLDACRLAVAAMGNVNAAQHIQHAIDKAEGKL